MGLLDIRLRRWSVVHIFTLRTWHNDLFPAIDLKGGQVVRLFKGDLDQATVVMTRARRRGPLKIRALSGCMSLIWMGPWMASLSIVMP